MKITTAGSVDDGKSTLIGRLMHDCNCIFEDKLMDVKDKLKNNDPIDFAKLTDGLQAEREQGITIDVAYLHFYTEKRHFLIADVPGHEQYTANMLTGASNSNIAVILVDAKKGIKIQSKRHLFIVSLLGIKHVLIAVNKMDQVLYDRNVFENIKNDFLIYAEKLNISDLQFIPISALKGDMLVERGKNMLWYSGRTFLDYLDNIQVSLDNNLIDLRMPVQMVIRSENNNRRYCGKLESGVLRKGDEIIVLPSFKKNRVKNIFLGKEQLDFATAPQSVSVTLDDETDVSRGDFFTRWNNTPQISNELIVDVFWMSEKPLKIQRNYLIKFAGNTVRGVFETIIHKINIDTLHREEAYFLNCNDIGKLFLKLSRSVCFDNYKNNKGTGSFIIIDEYTNDTVGGGIVLEKAEKKQNKILKNDIKHGGVLWFTGLSASGKSYLADKLYYELKKLDVRCERLDGDIMREVFYDDLGFTKEHRDRNIHRASYIANLLAKNNILVLASFITPYEQQRKILKEKVKNYVEIYVSTPLEVCEDRDPKGLYKKARSGLIKNFTGINDPFEKPLNPDIVIDTGEEREIDSIKKIVNYLKVNGFLL